MLTSPMQLFFHSLGFPSQHVYGKSLSKAWIKFTFTAKWARISQHGSQLSRSKQPTSERNGKYTQTQQNFPFPLAVLAHTAQKVSHFAAFEVNWFIYFRLPGICYWAMCLSVCRCIRLIHKTTCFAVEIKVESHRPARSSRGTKKHAKTTSLFFLSLPPICWEKVKGTFLFKWVMAVVLVLVRRRGVLGPLRSRSRAPFSGWEIEFGTLRSNFDSRLWLLAQLAFGLCEVSLFSTVELFFGERIVIFHLPIHGGLRFGTDICGPHVSSAVFLRAGPNPNLMPNFTGSFCARSHCFFFLPLRDEFNQRS